MDAHAPDAPDAAAGEDQWRWDPTLFGGAAPHYARGRLPYAPGLAEAMRTALGLDGTGALLDLGCGPGTVTIPFAQLYELAIGVDPDAEMIEHARADADRAGVGNTQWIVSRAEELPPMPHRFRTITMAQSFHWMDRALVARTAREMLVDGGVVVHVDAHHLDRLQSAPGTPMPPSDLVDDLRRRYLGPRRRAGQRTIDTTPFDEDAVLRAAGFDGPHVVAVPDGRMIVRTVDDLVDETLSMSMSAPHLFGDRLADFEADLRALLLDAGGSFAVTLPANELRIWRPA